MLPSFNYVNKTKEFTLTRAKKISEAIRSLLWQKNLHLEEIKTLLKHEAELLSKSSATIDLLCQQLKENHDLQVDLIEQVKYLQQLQQKCCDSLTPQYLDPTQVSNPEIALSVYLYAFLPNHIALDIGANVGDFSEQLLQVGYEVYAFEPFPPVFNQLEDRLNLNDKFHSFQCAIGSSVSTMDLHLVSCKSNEVNYDHPSVYSTLKPHAMPEELAFTDTIQVPVQSLENLHQSNQIPAEVGLVKIDTEGFDLEVIRGMGTFRYPVVIAEFWSEQHIFWEPGQQESGSLKELVREMSQRHYYWYIVICRSSPHYKLSFHCNYPQTPDRAWGNVFFFQNHEIFTQALRWCSATLPQTYAFQ
ncbi:MAG: FkbM family methyltransferase [Leptolyngbyaceae cyanobacterium bins.302]|nr:FkbM family methyltransferase [Leptolyngbyaceae cyanobacterium bins.302]